jgi:hypothetical protein
MSPRVSQEIGGIDREHPAGLEHTVQFSEEFMGICDVFEHRARHRDVDDLARWTAEVVQARSIRRTRVVECNPAATPDVEACFVGGKNGLDAGLELHAAIAARIAALHRFWVHTLREVLWFHRESCRLCLVARWTGERENAMIAIPETD